MITRIEATNYRCLEKTDIDLKGYAVLVGANGAGKTTLLDIPNLIADCLLQQNIGQAFVLSQNGIPPRCSTLQDVLFQGIGTHFILTLEAKLPEHVIESLVPTLTAADQQKKVKWWRYLRYEIRFEIFNKKELVIADEHLFLFSDSSIPEREGIRVHGEYEKKTWRVIIKRSAGDESGLRIESQRSAKIRNITLPRNLLALPKIQFESPSDYPAASWFYNFLSSKSVFYKPDLKKLQSASPPGLPDHLMINAENLPWLALSLQKDTMRFQYWIDHIRTALPQIENIVVREREEDHHAYFVVTYKGGYEVSSSGLSEGTLRILSLTILPYLNNLPALIITEEPENGIHPRAIESVLQSLSSVYDSQVLVSSHSPVVLAQSKLNQILCARLSENGAAAFVRGEEHPQLKDWQGKVDLGALFAAGVLG